MARVYTLNKLPWLHHCF